MPYVPGFSQTKYFLSFYTIPTPQPTVKQVAWDRMNSLYTARMRIAFKLAVIVYRCLHGLAPRNLSDDI